MTTSYLRSVACGTPRADDPQPGATVVGKEGQPMIWRLVWWDGHEHTGCFTHRVSSIAHLGLEEPRIRGLAMCLPHVAPGQPIPIIALPGLPTGVPGLWSLWRVVLSTTAWNRQRVIALFLHADGRHPRGDGESGRWMDYEDAHRVTVAARWPQWADSGRAGSLKQPDTSLPVDDDLKHGRTTLHLSCLIGSDKSFVRGRSYIRQVKILGHTTKTSWVRVA